MDIKERISVDLFTTELHLSPLLAPRTRLFLSLDCEIEELLRFPNGVETVVGNWNASTDFFTLDLPCDDPGHIYDLLSDRIWNAPACEYLARMISAASIQMGFGLRSFSMTVHATLTQERIFLSAPSGSPARPAAAPESLLQRLSEERTVDENSLKNMGLEADACSICLDDFLGSDKDLTQMPCSHVFHRDCVFEWLRMRNSCPLCRHETC